MIPVFLFLGVIAACALLFVGARRLGRLSDFLRANPAKGRRILSSFVLASALLRLGALILDRRTNTASSNEQPGAMQEAKILHQVAPVYPPLARQARIEGTVRVSALIDKAGNVAEAKLISGHPLLAAAALNAVAQWKYRAPTLRGRAVPARTTIELNFRLETAASKISRE